MPELGHIALFVRDLRVSVDFYTKGLGLSAVGKLMQGKAVALTGGRTHHELLLIEVGHTDQISQGRKPGLYHLAWKMGESMSELRGCRERLTRLGIPVDAAVNHIITQSLYLKDPDGNRIELYVDDPEFNWRHDDSWLNANPTPIEF